MLTIRCTACKAKLMKYNKLGKGEVLRCHKARVQKMLAAEAREDGLYCSCGARIGLDKGTYWKMVAKAFGASGKKVNKL